MRADFIHYFDDPNIMCVVGIKMFVGEGKTRMNSICRILLSFVLLSQGERRAREH